MGAREKRYTRWSDDLIAQAMEKLAKNKSYSATGKAFGVSKGSMRSLAIRKGFALEEDPSLKPAATSKPKPVRRFSLGTLSNIPNSSGNEKDSAETLSKPAVELFEKLIRLTQTNKPLTKSVESQLKTRLETIAIRVTNIHPDLKTLPVNVREVLNDCVAGVIRATHRSDGTQIILPPLPLVLTAGAALKGVEEPARITDLWSSQCVLPHPSQRNNVSLSLRRS